MSVSGYPGSRLCRLVVLILFAAGACGRPAGVGAQTELPPEVRQALEGNARSFGPIALMLEKKRTAPEPPTELTKGILGTVTGVLKPNTYEYLTQDGLCFARYSVWTPVGPSLKAKTQEVAWNGKSVYRGLSLQPPALSIAPFEKVATDPEFKTATWYNHDDYFRMIGILVPCRMIELPEGPRSEVLRLLEEDGRVTGTRVERVAGGEERFVVELFSGGKKHRFWLDPSRGHAVSRHEVSDASGTLVTVIENSDFVKLTNPELWLPRHCHAEWHMWPWVQDKPSRETGMVVDIQATRLERARVGLDRFTLNYSQPGSYISDAGLPGAEKGTHGRVDYLVPPDPHNLEEAIRAGQERAGYVPPRRPLVVWIICGSLALGLAAGAIVLIQRRRHSVRRPDPTAR